MQFLKLLLLEYGDSDKLTEIFLRSLEFLRIQINVCRQKVYEKTESPNLISQLSENSSNLIVFLGSADVLFECSKTLITSLRNNFCRIPILVVAEGGEPQTLFDLIESGVDDFVTTPFKPFEIVPRVRRLLQKNEQHTLLTHAVKEKFGLKHFIGGSPVFLAEIHKIPVFARCDVSVLILGETGTGKELCARAIHYLSVRSRGPFIPVNCGAIPVELMENELFGHEKGAFTGAMFSSAGIIKEAEKGTLFLDEVDCLPLSAQVKLLRFLQEKEYKPLGSTRLRKADVRVLAAMNMNLQDALDGGKLRQDLYYRLNVVPLALPSLRERREDIPLLAKHFIAKYSVEFQKSVTNISQEAIEMLLAYHWPGNVRELEHVIERAVLLSRTAIIQSTEVLLPRSGQARSPESFRQAKARMIASFESNYIKQLLAAHSGNITHAAQAARKNRRAFWQLMRKHNIDVSLFHERKE